MLSFFRLCLLLTLFRNCRSFDEFVPRSLGIFQFLLRFYSCLCVCVCMIKFYFEKYFQSLVFDSVLFVSFIKKTQQQQANDLRVPGSSRIKNLLLPPLHPLPEGQTCVRTGERMGVELRCKHFFFFCFYFPGVSSLVWRATRTKRAA